MRIVLGVDPGLGDLGWCAVELLEEPVRRPGDLFADGLVRERLIDFGTVSTRPAPKGKAKKSDDNLRRIHEQAVALIQIANRWPKLVAICAEAQSWPHVPEVHNPGDLERARGAMFGVLGASTMIAMSWGVIGTLSALLDVPVVQVAPQTMRRRLLGAGRGDKTALERALIARYGEAMLAPVLAIAKSRREHITDSLAAVVACLEEDVLRAVRCTLEAHATAASYGDIDFG